MNNNLHAEESSRRLAPLDSIRGVASFMVMLAHGYSIASGHPVFAPSSFWTAPFAAILNTSEPVIIFFVLSGYVLALTFFHDPKRPYWAYLVQRICRIYAPFAFCMTVIMAATPHIHVFDDHFRKYGSGFAGHFLMSGTSAGTAHNPVIWSLVHEMRISIIFPMLMILCRDTRVALAVTGILYIGSTWMLIATIGPNDLVIKNLGESFVLTLRIVPYFVAGILACKHRNDIHLVLQGIPERWRNALIAVPVFIFMIPYSYADCSRDSLYVLGSVMIIVLSLEAPGIRSLFQTALLKWMGRISYSLYLVHLPIVFGLFNLLRAHVPFGILMPLCMAASLMAAAAVNKFVERPAINFGRALTGKPRIPISAG